MNDLLFNLCILLGAIVLIVSAFVYANWRSQYSVFETHTPLWVSIPFWILFLGLIYYLI